MLAVLIPVFCNAHPKQVREALAALARKRESPSVGSKYSALLANQREERKDVVYNHRPHLLTGPPVQIYNPAFVTFIREMSHPPTTLEFSDKELDNALDFIDASLDLYESKFNRQSKIDDLRVLGRLISPEITIDARVVTPDGTTTITCPASKQEVTVRIVEVKNEIGEGGSDPIVQAECGFVLICSSKEVDPFLLVAPVYAQLLLPPFRSTNRFETPRVVRCFSSGSPARISLFLVPSLRKDLSRNDSRTTSTLGHSRPTRKDSPSTILSAGWPRFFAH